MTNGSVILCTDRLGLAAALWMAAAVEARAAGGHFDVDDATMLAPGRCQVEAWAVDGRSPTGNALHIGPACHAAGAEWGLNLDRIRIDGVRTDFFGPQAKWVTDIVANRLSAGAVLILTWRSEGTGRPIVTGYLPVTAWFGADGQLQINVNVGRDHDAVAGRFPRWGIGADWTAHERLTLLAERRSLAGQALTRVGVRLALTSLASIDASVARGGATRLLSLGFNWEWAR